MRVQMKTTMSGTYDGVELPPAGGEVEVSSEVGASLCTAGYAEPVATPAKPERATAKRAEKRG